MTHKSSSIPAYDDMPMGLFGPITSPGLSPRQTYPKYETPLLACPNCGLVVYMHHETYPTQWPYKPTRDQIWDDMRGVRDDDPYLRGDNQ